MSLISFDQWQPRTEGDISLKEGLLGLSNSMANVFIYPKNDQGGTSDAGQGRKIILQGKNYFDVKAYVLTGKDFPRDKATFDNEIQRESFKRLEAIDPEIYDLTWKGVTLVGSSCTEFYDNTLFRMVNAGTSTEAFCIEALGLLRESPSLNLHDHLMTLSDKKYKRKVDRDERFNTALSSATAVLNMLTMDADRGYKECADLLDALLKFKQITQDKVMPHLDKLVQQYSTGPVASKSGQTKPYLQFLHEDYDKSVKEMEEILRNYNHKYDQWKLLTGASITVGLSFGWVPIFGWVPLGVLSHEADEMHQAWAKLWEEYNAIKADNAHELILITWVTRIVNQFKDLDSKIDGAIAAVEHLCDIFQSQQRAYSLISGAFTKMEANFAWEDAETRGACIESSINTAVMNLQALQAAGANFVRAIIHEEPNFVKT